MENKMTSPKAKKVLKTMRKQYDLQEDHIKARITSYNVCYTKLLRFWQFILVNGQSFKFDISQPVQIQQIQIDVLS